VNLQNVEVSSFLGDLFINLRGGKLEPGLNRMIISGFIGDIQVIVPPDVQVRAHVSNFVGDVEVLGKTASGFGNNIESQTAGYAEAESHLFIAVNTFLGDTRIIDV
ncbi:MAG: cell wall-active antibiotics response protein LiaF, partial [candidate division Zixibacteria bacterium]